jgi:hypothetical protein
MKEVGLGGGLADEYFLSSAAQDCHAGDSAQASLDIHKHRAYIRRHGAYDRWKGVST